MQQQIESAWRNLSARSFATGRPPTGSSFKLGATLENVVITRRVNNEPYLPGEERTYIATFMGEPYSEQTVEFRLNGNLLREEDVVFDSVGWGKPEDPEGPVEKGWYLTFTMPDEPFTISVGDYTEQFSPDSVTPTYGNTFIEQARTDTPRTATAGVPFDIEVSVGCDDNNEKGCESQKLSVLVDGQQVTAGETGAIETGSRTKATFSVSISDPGEHTITIEGAGDSLDRNITVESGGPSMTLGPIQTPDISTLYEGQSASYSATITNDTSQSQTAEIIWRVGGTEVDRSTHTIPANTQQPISHTLSYTDIYNTVGSGYREVTPTLVAGDGWGAQDRIGGGFIVPEPTDDGGSGGGGGDTGNGSDSGSNLSQYITPTTLAAAGGSFFVLLLALLI